MKKKIIFLCLELNDLKIKNYEIKKFQKNYEIEIHECVNFLYPVLKNLNKKRVNNLQIKQFDFFFEWKRYIKQIKKNIIIFNLISRHNISGSSLNIFLLDFFLKKEKIITFKFELDGNPYYKLSKKKFFINLFLKLKSVVADYRFALGILKVIFFSTLGKVLKLYPSYLLVAGKKHIREIKKKKIMNMKIISGHEENYSVSLAEKTKSLKKKNYAVFLDDRDPSILPDGVIFSNNFTHFKNYSNWYKKLNDLFSRIEKDLNIEIIISAHPKSNIKIVKKLFSNKRVYQNKTNILVKNSSFVFTNKSSSLNFAVIYMKPIFFLESNLSKKIIRNTKFIENISSLLGCKIINLDDIYQKDIYKSNLKIIKKLYKSYFLNYISANSAKKSNFYILKNVLKTISV